MISGFQTQLINQLKLTNFVIQKKFLMNEKNVNTSGKKRNFNVNLSLKIAVNNSQNLNKFFKESEAMNFQED